jgi:hypothetical protein
MSDVSRRTLNRICIFCGSNVGTNPIYAQTAAELGGLLVRGGSGLVYGGGQVGLMGVVADAVLAAGGEVVGVIPEILAHKELLHTGVSKMHVVPSMHARKALMAELADAFVALPGGYGTFEEVLEVITWSQLGIHHKPVALLNVAGFFDPLVAMIDRAIAEGFIKPVQRDLVFAETDPAALLERLATHSLPQVRKWIAPQES